MCSLLNRESALKSPLKFKIDEISIGDVQSVISHFPVSDLHNNKVDWQSQSCRKIIHLDVQADRQVGSP